MEEVTALGVVVRIEHDLIHCPLVLDAQYLLHCCDRQHDRPNEARLPMMRVAPPSTLAFLSIQAAILHGRQGRNGGFPTGFTKDFHRE
jgi:hypothetical protein